MNKQKFAVMLKNHDWYYQYSDDYKVFCSGRDQLAKIQSIADSDPELKKVYDDYVKQLNEGD